MLLEPAVVAAETDNDTVTKRNVQDDQLAAADQLNDKIGSLQSNMRRC